MSAIKEFFKKKKSDAKFKLAGSGQKLGDATSSQPRGPSGPSKPAPVRAHPSQSAQQAGAAALNRLTKDSSTENSMQKNRQMKSIKEQARRELEAEQAVDKEVEKLKEVYGDREIPECLGPSQLEGVFYKCPLIGEEMYTKDVMKGKIKEFLYSQLESERALTAALIIHTCNSNKEKVTVCVDTLCKYIDNILKNPGEEKYKKIRVSNKAFQERVASQEGAIDFLTGCRFEMKKLPAQNDSEEDYWVFPEEQTGDLELLSTMKDCLISAEPIHAELARCTTVLAPCSGAQPAPSIPTGFFSVTKEEIKREQSQRTEELETLGMLRTKAMREKEDARGRRKYKFCLLRIRFPDNYIIQGTFSVYENMNSVLEWVTECLETPLPYQLNDSVTGSRLTDMSTPLVDLGLVPTAVLVFSWDPEIAGELEAAGSRPGFLREDLMKNA